MIHESDSVSGDSRERLARAMRLAAVKPMPTRQCRPVTPAPRWKDDRHAMILLAAYSRAASRDFRPGHELEDWLEAERQVDARLMGEHDSY
jgi:Protein of unknown function (DUF2934)